MPTDGELKKRWCQMASMCSLCGMAEENSAHLFLQCSYALEIWQWLSHLLNFNIDLSSFLSLFSICNKQWSSQLQDIIISAIVHVVWTIWFVRNSCRYEEIRMHSRPVIWLLLPHPCQGSYPLAQALIQFLSLVF